MDNYPNQGEGSTLLERPSGEKIPPPPEQRRKTVRRSLALVAGVAVVLLGAVWWLHHAQIRRQRPRPAGPPGLLGGGCRSAGCGQGRAKRRHRHLPERIGNGHPTRRRDGADADQRAIDGDSFSRGAGGEARRSARRRLTHGRTRWRWNRRRASFCRPRPNSRRPRAISSATRRFPGRIRSPSSRSTPSARW